MLKLTNADIENGVIYDQLSKFGTRFGIAERRKILAVLAQIKKQTGTYWKQRQKLFFLHGKEAPAGWPSAGQLVLDASLLGEVAYKKAMEELDKLQGSSFQMAWTKLTLRLNADEITQMSFDQQLALEHFFDIPE